MDARADIAIIGSGAAGLMASIWAGRSRTSPGTTVLALDGAKKLGAKILVAGGGRCNVTHHAVDESAYNGSSRNAIKKVLRRFDVPETVEFFRTLGVELKREETGKLFPTTDDAHTVLDALLGAVRDAGVRVVHPWRVASVARVEDGFLITRDATGEMAASLGEGPGGQIGDRVLAKRVILATGGMALPRSGSDGVGLQIARSLGHTVTPRVFPALVPLTVDPAKSFIPSLSGLTVIATVRVHAGSGKKLAEFTGSMMCTHFGITGPAVLDASRHYLDAKANDPGAQLQINWTMADGKPVTTEWVDEQLVKLGATSVLRFACSFVPERLARAICAHVGIEPSTPGHGLTKERRRALAVALSAIVVPVTGDRGFTFAEVTAGGVPLSEVKLETMESRLVPGLHLCGEICDVDGRIGGFNFQWAWASGFVAGSSAAASLAM